MIEFGQAPTLKDHSPFLRDDAERVERILDAVERNSIIEGLPPLTAELRNLLRRQLLDSTAPQQAPAE
jgi:hypothetical protein